MNKDNAKAFAQRLANETGKWHVVYPLLTGVKNLWVVKTHEYYKEFCTERQKRFSVILQPEIQPIMVKRVKLGEYVKRKIDSQKVYKRGYYDRSTQRYALEDTEDTSREIFLKGTALVYVDGFEH